MLTRLLGVFAAVLAAALSTHAQVPGVEHVVIIGVDGLAPRGIAESNTPHMDALIARGAASMRARAVMPTSSSSNWASMIMGAGPEQHGVTSNGWEVDKHDIPPIVAGPSGHFPTVFSMLRAAKPDAVLACFHDWGGFGRLVEPGVANVVEHCEGPQATVDAATACFAANRPLFTFIHLDHVDGAGHSQGWYTEPYNAAVEEADRFVGQIVQGLEGAGMLDTTILIVTSDHGGKDKSHGGATLEEIEIPWIIAGPGVRHGHTLRCFIDTYDTAATVLWTLGVAPHAAWIARPVNEAFNESASE